MLLLFCLLLSFGAVRASESVSNDMLLDNVIARLLASSEHLISFKSQNVAVNSSVVSVNTLSSMVGLLNSQLSDATLKGHVKTLGKIADSLEVLAATGSKADILAINGQLSTIVTTLRSLLDKITDTSTHPLCTAMYPAALLNVAAAFTAMVNNANLGTVAADLDQLGVFAVALVNLLDAYRAKYSVTGLNSAHTNCRNQLDDRATGVAGAWVYNTNSTTARSTWLTTLAPLAVTYVVQLMLQKSYTTVTGTGSSRCITKDNRGNIWVAGFGASKLYKIEPTAAGGTVTAYNLSFQPWGITVALNNDIWVVQTNGNKVAKFNGTVVTEYTLSGVSNCWSIAYGSDGRLWCTSQAGNSKLVAFNPNNPTGTIQQYSFPGSGAKIDSIISGANGNLLASDFGFLHSYWQITTSGNFSRKNTVSTSPRQLIADPLSVIWTANNGNSTVQRFSPNRATVSYSLMHSPWGITLSADRSVWVTGQADSIPLIRISKAGLVTKFSISGVIGWGVVQGDDGAVWIATENNIRKLTTCN